MKYFVYFGLIVVLCFFWIGFMQKIYEHREHPRIKPILERTQAFYAKIRPSHGVKQFIIFLLFLAFVIWGTVNTLDE